MSLPRVCVCVCLCVCVCVCLVTQSCPTLGNPLDCSLPGSSVHVILQEEYWSRLPFPPPGDFPNPGIELASPVSLALQGDSLSAEPVGKAKSPHILPNFTPYL